MIFSRDVVFNESEGRASTEHETREQEEYMELDISENDPELSEDVLEQPELAEPVPDEPNSEQLLPNIRHPTRSKNFLDYSGWSSDLATEPEPSSIQEIISTS